MEVQAVNPMEFDSCFLNPHRFGKPPSSAAMIKNRKRKSDDDQEIMVFKKLKALTELIEKPEIAVQKQQLVDEETEAVELKGFSAAIDEANNPVVQKQPIKEETVLKSKPSGKESPPYLQVATSRV
ncbi:variant surface glycoprotein (VSG, atypical) [Corchorus olitorius]|uniref:Variant surface glycoprotein (VSG, atypical) n=1 Tax=Corchorus olitorius TaxID=93759 RepID=A0A1R3KT38_9ROSI|nr:variant surface glycoprotein (VSG, atypical) [Corchorus olitorius]